MICFDNEEQRHAKQVNNAIQKDLRNHKRALKNTKKLLLLGAGESGKTTFIKQMRILHGSDYTVEELSEFRLLVFRNIYIGVQILIDAMHLLDLHYEISPNSSEVEKFMDIDPEDPLLKFPEEHYKFIRNIWKDAGVKECFTKRNKFQISDSVEYFLDSLDRVCASDYSPTKDDIVRVRLKTVGVHEYNFQIQGHNFLMVDVGGQRGERRKWIAAFENVQSVIFLTAISEYDQVLAESEEDENRLLESLTLFETIRNYPWFKNAAMVVFFNKKDLFDIKIMTSNLVDYFDYQGEVKNIEKAAEFIKSMFLDIYGDRPEPLYTHFTCATNTDQMKLIFEAVRNFILHKVIGEITGGVSI